MMAARTPPRALYFVTIQTGYYTPRPQPLPLHAARRRPCTARSAAVRAVGRTRRLSPRTQHVARLSGTATFCSTAARRRMMVYGLLYKRPSSTFRDSACAARTLNDTG